MPAASDALPKPASSADTEPPPEYPRPQLVRDNWKSLDGEWDYAIRPKAEEAIPQKWDGKIRVPFAVESKLSGVERKVGPVSDLWYRRVFTVPEKKGERLILNFGAVDWRATVFVNGREIGVHEGGFTPFSFDITEALNGGSEQAIVVKVWDPAEMGSQPRGKQISRPGGIWYTSVTGIWQTVWLEWVPASAVTAVRVFPDVDAGAVDFVVKTPSPREVTVTVSADGKEVGTASGEANGAIRVVIPDARLWSPEHPFLYDVKIEAGDDEVTSYFGMRKISLGKDGDFDRIFLNNKPLFQLGLLDQGYWPDGLYTAPNDEALRADIEAAKRFGFNMVRKHQKVEPARWYYWADKLGLLVWQDQPSFMQEGMMHQILPGRPGEARVDSRTAENFRKELGEMLAFLQPFACVVVWVPFNEGWGQHDTNGTVEWVKKQDRTRLVDGPSGWADFGKGDLLDMHSIPGPEMLPPAPERASVLGEFGGLSLHVQGHTWGKGPALGYGRTRTAEALEGRYLSLIGKLTELIPKGLSAAVYTQLTDVENEDNGLLTYDRQVEKIPAERIASINRGVIDGTYRVEIRSLLPTSEEKRQKWKFTTSKPPEGWAKSDFDDSEWKASRGGFGRPGTPGGDIKTEWLDDDIWMRQVFEVESPETLGRLLFRFHHDDDAEIYLNGVKVADLPGYTVRYEEAPFTEAAVNALRKGENVLAVHCRQRELGQYIDVGIVEWKITRRDSEF